MLIPLNGVISEMHIKIVRINIISLTTGPNIPLGKKIYLHIMGNQCPYPNIEFSLCYKQRIFNIFLNHKCPVLYYSVIESCIFFIFTLLLLLYNIIIMSFIFLIFLSI